MDRMVDLTLPIGCKTKEQHEIEQEIAEKFKEGMKKGIYDVIIPTEYHDDQTIFKVLDSLQASGLDREAAKEAVNSMQNNGILFRERR